MPRRSLSGWLRIGCGLTLVALLLWHAASHQAFQQLRDSPPDGYFLALSWATIVVSQVLSSLRWLLVARAAGLTMSVAESLRLGAIGFACNFVALGSVGGDVVKATLLAKPRPGQRGTAVTTVVVDRLLGLLGFLAYAAVAILYNGSAASDQPATLRILSQSTLVAAGVALAGFLLPMLPGRPVEWLGAKLVGTPVVGPLAQHGAELARVYRDGWRSLVGALMAGLVMNGMFILSFYAAATALPMEIPTLFDHLFIVPLAMISGVLPISPNGLGTIEAATEFLYRAVQSATPVGAGTLAALSHRLAMIVAGVTAAAYYYASGGRQSDIDNAAKTSTTTEEGSGTLNEPPAADTASRHTV